MDVSVYVCVWLFALRTLHSHVDCVICKCYLNNVDWKLIPIYSCEQATEQCIGCRKMLEYTNELRPYECWNIEWNFSTDFIKTVSFMHGFGILFMFIYLTMIYIYIYKVWSLGILYPKSVWKLVMFVFAYVIVHNNDMKLLFNWLQLHSDDFIIYIHSTYCYYITYMNDWWIISQTKCFALGRSNLESSKYDTNLLVYIYIYILYTIA